MIVRIINNNQRKKEVSVLGGHQVPGQTHPKVSQSIPRYNKNNVITKIPEIIFLRGGG